MSACNAAVVEIGGHGGIAVSVGSRGFLVVGCFFHNPRSGLAGVLAFALVFSELDPETPLRVGNPLHGGRGNLELPIAKSADSDSRDRAHPFDYSKIAFRHEHSFPQAQNHCQPCGFQTAPRPGVALAFRN
jgi:hypothetical protein